MPSRSWTTFAAGARQFVVQLALLMMSCAAGSYLSSFTPSTIVMSSPLAGALMITFFAPAFRWARALSASVKMPVDSRTMSTPRSPHGSVAGIRLLEDLDLAPVDDQRVVGVVDGAGIGAVRRVVLEEQGVHGRVDEVVDRHDLDVRRSLDQGLERLPTDPAEAVDADPNCHRVLLRGRRRPARRST